MDYIAKKYITAYIVWTNTDLCEGRGTEIPSAICSNEATANRLSKGGYVQGSDCRVGECDLFEINGRVYGPIYLVKPTEEDRKTQAILNERKYLSEKKKIALEKAKSLGMTEEEIELLKK